MQMKLMSSVSALLMGVSLAGCGGGGSSDSDSPAPTSSLQVPQTYTFASKFSQHQSSVSYSGQIARHALIAGLNSKINSLGAMVSSGEITASTPREDIITMLNEFYAGGTDVLATDSLPITTTPLAQQTTYADISSGKNLKGKTAGNDAVTEHKAWNTNNNFVGWGDGYSPESVLQEWFGMIADNAIADAKDMHVDANGGRLEPYQTKDGLDLKQLVQKHLLGALAFSQGVDDYLDDATADKGILVDNTVAAGDGIKPYTALEHHWDEGFGYFGAARDYNAYTDQEIAGKGGRAEYAAGYHDSNADGSIDLTAEYNFGASTNAAKRDLGSTTGTDFTKAAFDAFLTGRAIINSNAGSTLTAEQMTALKAQRDVAVENWEKAISATIVHYINEVLDDMEAFTTSYSYADHIKHWSEMKGFALGLQFNPRSPVSDAQFAELHSKIGTRPVLASASEAEIAAYKAALLDARNILQQAYGFAKTDVESW